MTYVWIYDKRLGFILCLCNYMYLRVFFVNLIKIPPIINICNLYMNSDQSGISKCLIYVICVCLRIVVFDAYCVVSLLCFSPFLWIVLLRLPLRYSKRLFCHGSFVCFLFVCLLLFNLTAFCLFIVCKDIWCRFIFNVCYNKCVGMQ